MLFITFHLNRIRIISLKDLFFYGAVVVVVVRCSRYLTFLHNSLHLIVVIQSSCEERTMKKHYQGFFVNYMAILGLFT